MPVSYILKQLGKKLGANPAIANQRATLLRFINEGAKELYASSDLPGCLQEQLFKVNGDQTITLPWYVGPLRGIREAASMQTWHVNQMRPRYNQFNWTDTWRNWRFKNKQALMNTVVNESVATITVPAIENPPIVVSVVGSTDLSSQISESITMDSPSKQTTNNYNDYVAITKDRVNNYDVTLTDIDGRILTIIPNNKLTAEYQIIDVSAAPWMPQNTSTIDNYMEVLFKLSIFELSNDTDEFPAMFNYDDAVVLMALSVWYWEQEKLDKAEAYRSRALRVAALNKDDQNKETEDTVSLVANPHDTMLKRIGTGIRRRYSLYAGRKY